MSTFSFSINNNTSPSVVPAVHEMEVKNVAENRNVTTVRNLYAALASGRSIYNNIASDLEWWFHGPQNCQHMMKMLTGKSSPSDYFKFEPRSIEAVDDECSCVIVEGWEGAQVYWVHVWNLDEHGVITQFREYFNTWLTVKDLRPVAHHVINNYSSSSSSSSSCITKSNTTLWQSHPRDLAKRSLPGIMLAI